MKEPKQPSLDEQIDELVAIMRKNGVDAWDLGFQGQLNPGALKEGLKIYIERSGYKWTKEFVQMLTKR